MVTLNFTGSLLNYFAPKLVVDTSTVLEALELVMKQHPMVGKMAKIPITPRGYSSVESLMIPLHTSVEVFIDPADVPEGYVGAGGGGDKKGALIALAIGIALVVIAGPAGLLASMPKTAMFVLSMGLNIAIGGLMQLLAPTPDEPEKERKSRYFSGDKMTVDLGTPIQMVFGTHRVYSHLLSFDIQARNYSGLDDPNTSPYFNQKSDDLLPGVNINRFYGVVKAGPRVRIAQANNMVNRTGVEL